MKCFVLRFFSDSRQVCQYIAYEPADGEYHFASVDGRRWREIGMHPDRDPSDHEVERARAVIRAAFPDDFARDPGTHVGQALDINPATDKLEIQSCARLEVMPPAFSARLAAARERVAAAKRELFDAQVAERACEPPRVERETDG